MRYFARTKDPSVISTPSTRRDAVVSVADAKIARTLTKLTIVQINEALSTARAAAPRRTMAVDNTIGWQDKQAYLRADRVRARMRPNVSGAPAG